MSFVGEVRSITALTHDEIVSLARSQAERGEPCEHAFPIGSTHAATWEHHYVDRRKDLEERDLMV